MPEAVLSIRLNVLLVGANPDEKAEIHQDYSILDDSWAPPLGLGIESAPFTTDYQHQPGAHLHWLLPECYTHGEEQPNGDMHYPAVPNRWLITRMWQTNSTGGAIHSRQWLVYSDGISKAPTHSKHTFPLLSDQEQPYRYLGHASPYPRVEAPSQTLRDIGVQLTAVLPGNPCFSAYYPDCSNIFGFHDKLDDVPTGSKIAYEICGWLESNSKAPRCAGEVSCLYWEGEQAYYPSITPFIPPKLAFAESSSEALASLTGQPLLEPLMEGLLHRLGTPEQSREAEYELYRRGFSAIDAGICYTVESGGVPAPKEVRNLFAQLNHLSQRYNRFLSVSKDLRVRLFSDWYLDTLVAYDPFASKRATIDFQQRIEKCIGQLERVQNRIKLTEKERDDVLRKLKANLPQNMQIKEQPEPRYWLATDPVVLFYGGGARHSPQMLQKSESLYISSEGKYNISLPPDCACPPELSDVLPELLDKVMKALQIGTPPTEPTSPWSPLFLEWQVNFTADAENSVDPIANWKLNGLELYPDKVPSGKRIPILGRIVLTPHASQLKEAALRMRARRSRTREDELFDAAKNAGEEDTLSQQLSGLQSEFLMQKPGLVLPPVDYQDRVELAQKIAALVEDGNDIRPNPQGSFYFTRSGAYTLDNLKLVDSFGRIRSFDNLDVAVPERLTIPKIPRSSILAPPRITKPARIRLQWRSACDDTCIDSPFLEDSPIAGWLCPCPADRSLFVYTPKGKLLGSLRSFRKTDGAYVVLWENPPGEPVLDAVHNPILAEFIYGLQKDKPYSNNPLEELFRCISSSPSSSYPHSEAKNRFFQGRMVALVRCQIKLEIQGMPAQPNSFSEQKIPAPVFHKFPVQMGDLQNPSDGLCGYFIDDMNGFENFYSPYAQSNGDYVLSGSELLLNCNAKSRRLTLLIDPAMNFQIVSGFLPPESFGLDAALLGALQQRIAPTVGVAPILLSLEQSVLRIPLSPAGDEKQWAWIEHENYEHWSPKLIPASTSQNAFESPGLQRIAEGWLSLEASLANNAEKSL